jgi:hypothetical protein
LLTAGVRGAAGRRRRPVVAVLVRLMGVWSCHHPAAPRAGARGSGGGGLGASRCRR